MGKIISSVCQGLYYESKNLIVESWNKPTKLLKLKFYSWHLSYSIVPVSVPAVAPWLAQYDILKPNFHCLLWLPIMEPPTMLLVPICRDMQLWWDKPPIQSPRKCMPSETCFDDVGRICACVTWTQMYVTLQTKNVFHSKAVIILFFNQPLCFIFSITHFNIEEIL